MVKIKGISKTQLDTIYGIIGLYPSMDFFAYGSRVNGNFSPNSDLDIIVRSASEISYDILDELNEKFDQSDLPFIVHISDYHKLDDGFVRLIENSMIKL